MTYQELVGTERVPIRAAGRWVGDPLPGRGQYEFAESRFVIARRRRR